jgi:hypothetical protein
MGSHAVVRAAQPQLWHLSRKSARKGAVVLGIRCKYLVEAYCIALDLAVNYVTSGLLGHLERQSLDVKQVICCVLCNFASKICWLEK